MDEEDVGQNGEITVNKEKPIGTVYKQKPMVVSHSQKNEPSIHNDTYPCGTQINNLQSHIFNHKFIITSLH